MMKNEFRKNIKSVWEKTLRYNEENFLASLWVQPFYINASFARSLGKVLDDWEHFESEMFLIAS